MKSRNMMALLAAFALTAAGAFGEQWLTPINLGFGVPIAKVTTKDDFEFSEVAYAVNFGATFINMTNGLTFRLNTDLGFGSGEANGTDSDTGFDFDLTAGVGYSFVRTTRFVCGATVAFGIGHFGCDVKTVSVSTNWLLLGGDMTALYRFNRNWGISGNIGIYKILPAMSADIGGFESDIDGRYRIVPRVSAVFTY